MGAWFAQVVHDIAPWLARNAHRWHGLPVMRGGHGDVRAVGTTGGDPATGTVAEARADLRARVAGR